METITYKEFLKKFVKLEPNQILVTKHPYYHQDNDDELGFYPSQWYWINGGEKLSDSFLSKSDFCFFIFDEPIFIKYIEKGSITNDQLEKNLGNIYDKLSCCVFRTLGRHIQIWYGEQGMAELIIKACVNPFENPKERKLQISPFEVPADKEKFQEIYKEIWEEKRGGDKIEDTVTDYEIITPEDFWRRIGQLRTLDFGFTV